MAPKVDLQTLARFYHRFMPPRIRQYLNGRGIPDDLIDAHLLGWNGSRITIPVFDRDGNLGFFKLAKDPEDSSPDAPKMLATPGARAELYGWEHLRTKPDCIIICEGEFDRLVLEAHGLEAVTSTGGAGVFREEWVSVFEPIREVYICYDNDEAGRNGALRVGQMIPHAKLVELPADVGESGDVTDFFVRLGRSQEDFLQLLEQGKSAPPEEKRETPPPVQVHARSVTDDEITRLKSLVSIEQFIGRSVPLHRSGQNWTGRCPFHEDRQPSFVVFPQTQTFYCFGCQAHGDLITFLMRAENLTFPEALNVLRQLSPSS
jgi:DNA primase